MRDVDSKVCHQQLPFGVAQARETKSPSPYCVLVKPSALFDPSGQICRVFDFPHFKKNIGLIKELTLIKLRLAPL